MHYSKHLPAACLLASLIPASLIPASLILASLILPPAASAQGQESILDHSGQLRRVLTGTYSELFDDGDGALPVLAIETVAPAGAATRVLVPGTDDARLESSPLLVQNPRLEASVLLWRSRAEQGGDRLDFATYDGAQWSEVLTLEHDGAPVSLSGELKTAETHDSFDLELEDGVSISAERLIIHLLWQSGDVPRTYYAPLTFVAGHYLGQHAVFVLDDLLLLAPGDEGDEGEGGEGGEGDEGDEGDEGEGEGGEGGEQVALTAALARVFEPRVSSDDLSVQVTFANSSSQRIGSLEIRPLPLELEFLGEQVREQIFALADLYDPNDMSSFSDGMRAGMVIIGQRFNLHDAHGGYLADHIADWLLATGGSYGWAGLEDLGADARDRTIDVTSERYVATGVDSADPTSEILGLDVSWLFENPEEPEQMQVFDFSSRCDLPAPAIDEGPVAVFTSRQGSDLLIAWENEEGGQIHWVESRGARQEPGPWSAVFTLPLGEQLTIEAAHRLLADRIR